MPSKNKNAKRNTDMSVTSVLIPNYQRLWLDAESINVSSFFRDFIDFAMKNHEGLKKTFIKYKKEVEKDDE